MDRHRDEFDSAEDVEMRQDAWGEPNPDAAHGDINDRENSGNGGYPNQSRSRSGSPAPVRGHSRSRSPLQPPPQNSGRDYRRERSRSPGARRYRERSPFDQRREESQAVFPENPGNNLFVSGLSSHVTERELEDAFTKYGKIVKCQVMRDPHTHEHRGFAFVTMETTEQADDCKRELTGFMLYNRAINVETAKRSRPRTPTPGQYQGGPKSGGGRERGMGRGGYDRGGRDFDRGGRGGRGNYGRDHDRGGRDYDRGGRDHDRNGGRDYDRGARDYDRGGRDYDRGARDFNRGGYERGGYERADRGFDRHAGGREHDRGNRDFERDGNRDYNRGGYDRRERYERR